MRQTAPRLGRRRRTLLVAVTVLALLVPVGWALLVGDGAAGRAVDLTGGRVWLATPGKGFVSLIDGPSEQLMASVPTPAGPGVSVTQDGESAFVADDATGTVTRVDGRTYEASAAASFGSAGHPLQVLIRDGTGYVVNSATRVASLVNPATLAVSQQLNLSARPGDQQVLLDGTGRLWTVDADGAGMSWIDSDGGTGRVDAAGDTRLLEVDRRPVWVARSAGRLNIGWLGTDGQRTEWPCSLGTRDGDTAQLLGSTDGQQVFAAVSQTGSLLIADAQGSSCDAVITVGETTADFGGLVQAGQFVFIPDRSTGSTVVVDLALRTVVAVLPLTEADHDLELVGKDDIVFYNDRDSEKTGVLRQAPDGSWGPGIPVEKYDPKTGVPADLSGASSSATTEAGSSSSASGRPCEFFEPFDGPVEPPWEWADTEVHYSYSIDGGVLTIGAPDGSDLFATILNAPRLWRQVTGDFTIETEVLSESQQFYQGAGLLLWADSEHYLRLERGYGELGVIVLQYWDAGFVSIHGPKRTDAPVATDADPVVLRLTKTSTQVTAQWRPAAEVEWRDLDPIGIELPDTLMAGVAVQNRSQAGASPAPYFAEFQFIRGGCLG